MWTQNRVEVSTFKATDLFCGLLNMMHGILIPPPFCSYVLERALDSTAIRGLED